MKRMGWVIRIRPEKIQEYKVLHADVWPGVLKKIRECNIRNYSIYLREPENLLFGYFEYHGNDFDADMAEMANDEETQRWWKATDPCQVGLETRSEGEWWASTEEVFHCD